LGEAIALQDLFLLRRATSLSSESEAPMAFGRRRVECGFCPGPGTEKIRVCSKFFLPSKQLFIELPPRDPRRDLVHNLFFISEADPLFFSSFRVYNLAASGTPV
jgi:hypothetical protein